MTQTEWIRPSHRSTATQKRFGVLRNEMKIKGGVRYLPHIAIVVLLLLLLAAEGSALAARPII